MSERADAIHEAAHAVFARMGGATVDRITLDPPACHYTLHPEQMTIANYLAFTIAGMVAEKVIAGKSLGPQEDLNDAIALLRALGFDEDQAADGIKAHIEIVKGQVEILRDQISDLADELQETGSVEFG